MIEQGFAIGIGLMNPAIQYKAYRDHALQMKLIQQSDHESNNELIPECEKDIALCGENDGDDCLTAYSSCTFYSIKSCMLLEISVYCYYDIRKQCEENLCYDFSNMEKFLTQNLLRMLLK